MPTISILICIAQYADDIFIFRNVYSNDCDPDLQNDLMTIADWAKSNCLQLNPDKCKTVPYPRETFLSHVTNYMELHLNVSTL